MNACMYVCIFMLCFMLASTVHNLDCYFTSVYLWLCILFLLIVNLLLILRFILIMCVCLQLSSFCLFYFVCRSFLLIYSIRLRLCLQLPLIFSVLLHAFWWWIPCLIVLFPVYFTSSSPSHPILFFVCFFLAGILCYFPLYMLLRLL